jgi:hypothetical protein
MSGTESAKRVRRVENVDVDNDVGGACPSGEEVGVGSACTGALDGFSCQTAQTYWKGNGRSFVIKALWKVEDLRVGMDGCGVVVFSGSVREKDSVGTRVELMLADDLEISSMRAWRTVASSAVLASRASWVLMTRYCSR